MGSSRSLALSQRALEFGREALRLQPSDPTNAGDFAWGTEDTVARFSDSGRKDEAIAELRRSLEILGEVARGNADTPLIQETYLRISQGLVDRLAEQKRPGEAARALLESREWPSTDFPEPRRPTSPPQPVGKSRLARRLGEVQPDLTPEQKVQRDELLDRAVSDYRAAVAAGWSDVALLKAATPIKDRPGYSDLLAEAETAAGRPEKPTVSGGEPVLASATSRPASAVSRPKLDVKLDRATTQAALGVARARSGLVDEALTSMEKARTLFDGLERERPGDPKVKRGRLEALLDFHEALSALALVRLRRGQADGVGRGK